MPTPRRLRTFTWIWVGMLLFLIAATATLRHFRHSYSSVGPIHGSVMGVHGQVSDFFAAKAGGQTLLFDAGADPEGRALDALLGALGATRDSISDVFLTHGHGDHIAGAPLATHARIHGGIGDSDMMAQRTPMVPRLARFVALVLPVPPVMLTDAILARTEIPVPGGKTVLAIPFGGHTPGSMVYLYDGVLFAGDSMNYEKDKLTFAVAPFSVDTVANHAHIASLPTLIPLDQIKVVCTAHGGCTPEADTRRLLDDVITRAARS